MDLQYIKDLIQILEKSNVSRLTIKEKNGVEIILEKDRSPSYEVGVPVKAHPPTTMPHIPEAPLVKAEKPVSISEEINDKQCVKSPMVGTFYVKENPTSPPFKQVGDEVNVGDVVCIVEAMKVMNEIKSTVKGKLTKVLTEDGSPVEYGQSLFVIE